MDKEVPIEVDKDIGKDEDKDFGKDPKDSDILKFNISMLKVLLLWPLKGQENNKAINTAKIVLYILLFTPTTFALLADLYQELFLGMRDDIISVIEVLLALNCTCSLIYNSLCFSLKRKEIMNLIPMLENLEKYGVPATKERTEQRTKLFSRVFFAFGVVACSIYILGPLFYIEECEENKAKAKYGKDIPCGLYVHLRYPFRIDYSPRFEIAETLLVCHSTTFGFVALFISSFQGGLVMHIVGHIKMLKTNFQKASLSANKRRDFNRCIEYHNEIIKFCESLNDCFSSISFFHVSFTSIILSILGYEFLLYFNTLHQSVRYFLHLMGWILVLLFVCFNGQQLIDESLSVAEAIYDIEWPDDVTLQRDMVFVILRSQKPLVLNTGAFGILSYEMFLSIMATTYSYFTLLACMQ